MPSRATFSLLAVFTSALLALAVGGCAWTQDERDFYGRGWMNPRDLDRPSPPRGPRPAAGERPAEGTPTSPRAQGGDSSINRQ